MKSFLFKRLLLQSDMFKKSQMKFEMEFEIGKKKNN